MLRSAPSSTVKPVDKPIEKLNFSSTHAESMVKEGVLTTWEANMWADALCMDSQIVESVVWSEIAEMCKDQIVLSKPFITTEEIKKLPEFKQFLAQYMAEKGRIYQTTIEQENQKHKKDLVASIGISPDLQAKREKINRIKTAIRTLISEKDEKSRWDSAYMSYIVGAVSGEPKLSNVNVLYDYIYESLSTLSEKKRRKTNEDAYSFYKRVGPDYSFKKIREKLTAEESKINTQIWKQKAKEVTKFDQKKSQVQTPIIDQKVYEEEAFTLFCKTGNLEDTYYLEKNTSEISHLQDFFRKSIQKSKHSHSALTINENIDKKALNGMLIRQEDSVILSPSDYIHLQVNQKTINNYFASGDRTIKGYLFDRLIECVGYDILEYKIKENLSHFPQYRWASFELYKTEMLDDTFAKADYALELRLPHTKDIEIELIDLFVSDKSKDSVGYQEKYKKAQEPKIPYQMYINLLLDKKDDTITMMPFKRFVEQQSPKEVHDLLLKVIKEPGFNIQKYLLEKSERARLLGRAYEKDLIGEMRRLSA